MDFTDAFNEIVSALDEIDTLREKVMVLSRKGVRLCSEAIKKMHRREEGAESLLAAARAALVEMREESSKHPAVDVHSHFETLYQELVEATLLHCIFTGAPVPCPSAMDPPVPAVHYVLGACDAVGELRRACLDGIRLERFDDALRYFEIMERLHEQVNALDYPNAVIPNVRHKVDVNRKLVHATRSDLTMAIHISKLNNNLKNINGA